MRIGELGLRQDRHRSGGPARRAAETPRFDPQQVGGHRRTRRRARGGSGEGELFTFEVQFKPNQDKFPAELYADAFKRVANLAATYGGAVITVEGHSDPLGYLQAKKDGASPSGAGPHAAGGEEPRAVARHRRARQRDRVRQGAGHRPRRHRSSRWSATASSMPKSGMCGGDPCAPKNEQEWLAQHARRVPRDPGRGRSRRPSSRSGERDEAAPALVLRWRRRSRAAIGRAVGAAAAAPRRGARETPAGSRACRQVRVAVPDASARRAGRRRFDRRP